MIGVVVGTEGWLGENTSVETSKGGVHLSQSIVSSGCHNRLTQLKEHVISHSDSITMKEVLGSKELDTTRHSTSELGEEFFLITGSEGGPSSGHESVDENLLEHDDLSALFRAGTHEVWAPSITDVDMDSL